MTKKRTTPRSPRTKKAAAQNPDVQNSLQAEPSNPTPEVPQTPSAEDRQSLGLDSILGAVLGAGGPGGGMPQQGGMGGGQDPLSDLLGAMTSGQGGMPQQQGGQDPLGAILGSMMGGQGGGMPQRQYPSDAMGAQAGAGGLDMGSILGGLLGGGLGSGNMGGGLLGGAAGALLGPLVDSIAEKTGLPKAIVMAGATFLLSKLLSGGQQGQSPMGGIESSGGYPQQGGQGGMGGIDLGAILGGLLGGGAMGGGMPVPQQGGGYPQQGGGMPPQQGGEIDLGSILGSILGGAPGGGLPGLPDMGNAQQPQHPQQPQGGGVNVPDDKVLGKIGESMNSAPSAPQAQPPAGGIRIQGLVAGQEQSFLQERGLVNEFAQQEGIDEQTAEESLTAILKALDGR
jgi:hypothetical protein